MQSPSNKPTITINFCTLCGWMLRSTWMAQELLSTFGDELGEVALVPGRGGVFTIHANDTKIWDRTIDGGFPDAVTLKNRVKESVLPDWQLGHHVKAATTSADADTDAAASTK